MIQQEALSSLYAEWKMHPFTRALFRWAAAREQSIKDQWAGGEFTGETHDATAQLNARALGEVQAAQRILGFELEDAQEFIE